MAKPQAHVNGLADLLDTHLEWLVIRENGRSLPFLRSEIEVDYSKGKTTIGFVDEKGLAAWRVEQAEFDGVQIVAKLSSKIRNE